MIKKTKGNISYYVSKKLNNYPEIFHFYTTRNFGVSKGQFESLNFGTHHGEENNMKTNLSLLAKELNLDFQKIVIPKQTHKDIIAIVDIKNYSNNFEDTDALITNVPSIILTIKTADCVPILLYDPVKKAIGAVHSGWKGTAQNIVGKTITKMIHEYGSDSSNIIAAIGPCISSLNYEVGEEVIHRIKSVISNHEKILNFGNEQKGKAYLDLTQANFQLLVKAGVTAEKIDTSGLCTFTMKDDFFSARRDGNITGRMINCITLK